MPQMILTWPCALFFYSFHLIYLLLRDAVLACYVLWPCLSVCLSVYLSVYPYVRSKCSIKTIKFTIMKTIPVQGLCLSNSRELDEIPVVAPNKKEVGKNRRFSTSILLYLRIVAEWDLVTIEISYELVCAVSNGCYFQWLQRPLTNPNHAISTFCTAFNSFVTTGDRLQVW